MVVGEEMQLGDVPPIQVCSESIEAVTEFEYLGAIVSIGRVEWRKRGLVGL